MSTKTAAIIVIVIGAILSVTALYAAVFGGGTSASFGITAGVVLAFFAGARFLLGRSILSKPSI